MSTTYPFISVRDLRMILEDTRLHDEDLVATLTLAQTGNLPILRGGHSIGWIAVSPVSNQHGTLNTENKSYLHLVDQTKETQ